MQVPQGRRAPKVRKVSLTVEPTVRRKAGVWPVTSGVPFPPGAVAADAAFALSVGGRPTLAQFRVLSKWDGYDGGQVWLAHAQVEVQFGTAANPVGTVSPVDATEVQCGKCHLKKFIAITLAQLPAKENEITHYSMHCVQRAIAQRGVG